METQCKLMENERNSMLTNGNLSKIIEKSMQTNGKLVKIMKNSMLSYGNLNENQCYLMEIQC
jgi:hypothetical protein